MFGAGPGVSRERADRPSLSRDRLKIPQEQNREPVSALFQLVSTDAAGTVEPLPTDLGPLPLYRLDDGFYSVLDPSLNRATPCANQSPHHIANGTFENNTILSATLTPARIIIFCGAIRCPGASGPHSCLDRSFICNARNCHWTNPFKTKQGFNRHYEAVHLAERVDCPIPGCENVGERGIKRYDNLAAHLRTKHGI
ncbi:unnamed protein product [Tuber aestivum]|uniref:C2H2-type domain-containing protein n=1 Tax=Tuber aestivum TaxID=59557 RepID=A0A292PN64_9PEZI|nr:unnamed protein product [Tuber aestivum]